MELCGRRTMFTPGLSFGSRYVVSPLEGQVFDYLPETMMPRVRNVRDFAGILALDKWTCNANGRQAAFWKKSRERKLTATLHRPGILLQRRGVEFSGRATARRIRPQRCVLCVTSWESFEPWLSKIENFPESSLWPLADEIPPEWYGGATDELERLLQRLLERRLRVRELILDFKNSSRNPFPNWREAVN